MNSFLVWIIEKIDWRSVNMRPWLLSTICCLAALPLTNTKADWPCYHGRDRDNLSKETGLLQSWPEDGPPLLWTAEGLGKGYSSMAIAEGRLFTAGMIDKQTYVIALDVATGGLLWQRLNGRSWEASRRQPWAVPYAGSRGTPTVEGDTVYHLSEMGRLSAFDVRTGETLWHRDLLKDFRRERPKYGYSESVLLRGDLLFCCPAGAGGYIAAFDKGTGRTVWTNSDIKDAMGNASSIIASLGGIKQIVTVSATRVLSFAPEDGRLLWEHPSGNSRGNSATDVIVHNGLIYTSSGYGGGSLVLRPQRQADGTFSVERVWQSDLLDNHHGGVILLDDHLYGAGHEAKGWFCLDFATGEQHWQASGKGSLTYADDRLYCLNERGTMHLIKASSDAWEEAGSFKIPRGGSGLYWAHPVVCEGRLYVRHGGQIFAYDVNATKLHQSVNSDLSRSRKGFAVPAKWVSSPQRNGGAQPGLRPEPKLKKTTNHTNCTNLKGIRQHQ